MVVVPLWPDRVGEPVLLSMGTSSSVTLNPAVVLGCVLRSGADSFALLHTHVDERPPSAADAAVTRRLVAATAVCGLTMVGHLVLTPNATYDCMDARASRAA